MYVKRIGSFLIVAALVAGMVGCGGGVEYDLTISSTEGGEVTTPSEGTFTYDKGIVVDLVAKPETGYLFVNWTGDVATIGNVNAIITTVTIDDHYSITANFAQITPMVAAGGYHTVGLKTDGTVVAAGLEVELAKWDLIEAVP